MLPIGLSYFPASKFVTGNFTRGCLDCWTSDLWWFSILASKISDQYVCLNFMYTCIDRLSCHKQHQDAGASKFFGANDMLPTWKSLHTTHQLVSSHSLLNQAWFSWLESNGIIGCGWPFVSVILVLEIGAISTTAATDTFTVLHIIICCIVHHVVEYIQTPYILGLLRKCFFHNIQFTNTLVTIVILAKSMFLPLRVDSKSLAFRRIPPRVAQVQRSPAEFFWILSFLLLR